MGMYPRADLAFGIVLENNHFDRRLIKETKANLKYLYMGEGGHLTVFVLSDTHITNGAYWAKPLRSVKKLEEPLKDLRARFKAEMKKLEQHPDWDPAVLDGAGKPSWLLCASIE